MNVTTEELNTKIYERMYDEQQAFIEELKKSSPENIINQAYELVIREDLLISLEYNNLSAEQCKAFLKEKKPLGKLFHSWENHEGNHMTEIRDCIENFANDLISQRKGRMRSECR